MAALVGEVAEVEADRGVHRVGYLVQRNIFLSRTKVQGRQWTPASEPGPGAPGPEAAWLLGPGHPADAAAGPSWSSLCQVLQRAPAQAQQRAKERGEA